MQDDNADVALLRAKVPYALETVSLATHSLPKKDSTVRCAGFRSIPTKPLQAALPEPPRMLTGQVAEVNRYQGAENFEFAGLIPQGFSGAAVLNEDDQLVGLAVAIDPQDNRTVCSPAAEIRKLLAGTETTTPVSPERHRAVSAAEKYFPSQSWVANAKFILRTEEATYYFHEWIRDHQTQTILFKPFAMIRFPKGDSSKTPLRILSDSARLRFEKEFSLAAPGKPGRLLEAEFLGTVRDGANYGMKVSSRGVKLSAHKYTQLA